MDTLAYFGGRKFGKRKFLKNISPNKTLEGFSDCHWYSSQLCLLFCLALLLIFPLWAYLLFFFITSLFSVLGDAVASLFKRIAGVKDSSNLIPGHGGVF